MVHIVQERLGSVLTRIFTTLSTPLFTEKIYKDACDAPDETSPLIKLDESDLSSIGFLSRDLDLLHHNLKNVQRRLKKQEP